jgi:probable O-glycosylation ligase (exosortase A-associated)
VGKLFFLTVLSSAAVASFARPWIGVACAYWVALLTPQAIWWWNFDGVRPVYWVMLPTLTGFCVALFRQQYDLSAVRNWRVRFLIALWLAFTISYYFGPYVDYRGPYRFTDASWVFGTLNKILLLCIVACVCVNDVRSLKSLCFVFLFSALYLAYWANDQYFSGHLFGRLQGPVDLSGTGIYSDENSFAMLFVVATPFVWCIGHLVSKRLLRWALWLTIPFAWHALFLTASRAGLLGIAVVTLLLALRSRKKVLGLALVPGFVIFYAWQAGDLMQERAETITDFRTEASAASRLEAWNAALGMIADHPITGVGLASFGPAFPDYSQKKPREAHNTLLQISAESGIVGGTMYLLVATTTIAALWGNARRLRKTRLTSHARELYYINEATLISLCGLLVCSMFASLQIYEIFYFLFVVANGTLFASRAHGLETSRVLQTTSTPKLQESTRVRLA